MFKFFKNLVKSKNVNSRSFRYEMAKHLVGRHIKYVTERIDDVDIIVGHEGELNIKGDQFIVISDCNIIFRAYIPDLKAGELLSLEGVILTAPDIEHDNKQRTIIAYYKYYR